MILNMYQHQVDCAGAILKHERHRGSAFDYIVAVREDTYFFSPVDMDVVVRSIGEGCDLVSKECHAYDGLNMRFQLLRGSKGWPTLLDESPSTPHSTQQRQKPGDLRPAPRP